MAACRRICGAATADMKFGVMESKLDATIRDLKAELKADREAAEARMEAREVG